MIKKIAALGLTAALVFAPVAAFAQQDATPAPAPTGDAAAPATDAKPVKAKHHMAKHHTAKHHTAKHHAKKKADAAPAGDAAPADAPK
jgi:hypothetical protein